MNPIPSTPITASPLRTLTSSSSSDPIRSAVLQFTVNALGILLIGAIYLNYVLLKSYFTPLFWGFMLSVPLHSIKRRLIAALFSGNISLLLLQKEKESILGWMAALCQRVCQIVFGPFADLVFAFLEFYSHLVQRISLVDTVEEEIVQVDASTPVPLQDNRTPNEIHDRIQRPTLFTPSHRKNQPTFPSSPTPLRHVAYSTGMPIESEHDSSSNEEVSTFKTPSKPSRRLFTPTSALSHHRTLYTPGRSIKVKPSSLAKNTRSNIKLKSIRTRLRRPKRQTQPLFEPFVKLTKRWHRGMRSLNITGTESPNTFLAKLAHNYHQVMSQSTTPLQDNNESNSSSSRSSVSSTASPRDSSMKSGRSSRRSTHRSNGDPLWTLVLWTFRYIIFLLLKSLVANLTVMDIIKPIVHVAGLHLGYHIVLALFRYYFTSRFKPLSAWIPSGHVNRLVHRLGRVSSQCIKYVMAQHMNGFITLLLIISSILFTTSTATLLLFKVVQEGALMLDSAIVPALNQTLIQNQELNRHVEQAVITLRSNALDFLDSRILENYPGLNVTARDVYDRVLSTLNISRVAATPLHQHTIDILDNQAYLGSCLSSEYGWVVDACACALEQRNQPITWIPAVKPLISNMHSFSYSETDFPVTSRLVRKLSRGKFKSFMRLIVPSFIELRTKLVSSIQPLSFLYKNETDSSTQNLTQADVLKAVSSASAVGAGYVFNVSIYVLAVIISALVNAFDLVFKATLFFASLYTCLVDEKGIVYKLSRILVVLDPKEKLRMQLEHGIKSALIVNVKMMLYHLIFTWLTYHAAGCELVYIPTFIAGFLSLIPLISPLYVFIPGSISLFLKWPAPWGMLYAFLFFLAHAFVAFIIDAQIVETEMVLHQKHVSSDRSSSLLSPSPSQEGLHQVPSRPSALITGLAFWLGYWNFGGIEGLVLGPILVSCVPILVHHFYGEIVASLL